MRHIGRDLTGNSVLNDLFIRFTYIFLYLILLFLFRLSHQHTHPSFFLVKELKIDATIFMEFLMQYWIIVERLENWKADKKDNFTKFGLKNRNRQVASSIEKGDILISYISSRISSFADIREATASGVAHLKSEDDYDTAFELYVATSPKLVLDRPKWLPVKEIVTSLELTMERKEWASLFRTSLRKLSEKDGRFLTNLMFERDIQDPKDS